MRRLCLAVSLLSSLAACGGGGGGGAVAPPPPQAFNVLSNTPADGASSVARDTPFVATFSAPVQASSLSAANVTLLGPEGNPVSAAATASGANVQIGASAGALPGNSKYTVTLGGGITDNTARTLGTSSTHTFTTAAQNWGAISATAATLPNLTGGAAPTVVSDSSGNVIALWHYDTSVKGVFVDTLFAARMDGKSGTWGAPTIVYTEVAGYTINNLNAVAGPNGDAYVTWSDATEYLMHYSAASNSWSSAPMPAYMAQRPAVENIRLVAGPDGSLAALIGVLGHLYATRYNAQSSAWSVPYQLDVLSSEPYLPEFDGVVDAQGNLTVAWVQQVSDGSRVLDAAYYQAAAGSWSAAQTLENDVLTGAFDAFSMSHDAGGRMAITWTRSNHGGTPAIYASRFDPAQVSWSTALQLDDGKGPDGAYHSALASDGAGYITVVWMQYQGLYGTRYNPAGANWSAPARITPADTGSNTVPVLRSDVAGNTMLLFVASSNLVVSNSNLQMSAMQYTTIDGQWHAPVFIGAPASGSVQFANDPTVVCDPSGTMTVVWLAQDANAAGLSQYRVAANRFK